MRYATYALLLLLYVLHTDVWYWDDPRIVAGLPIGVTYHVAWMLAVSAAFWLVVQYAWPQHLEDIDAAPAPPHDGDQGPHSGATGTTP
jgi:hypothetical protein